LHPGVRRPGRGADHPQLPKSSLMLRSLMLRPAVHIITSFVYVIMNHLTKGGKYLV